MFIYTMLTFFRLLQLPRAAVVVDVVDVVVPVIAVCIMYPRSDDGYGIRRS